MKKLLILLVLVITTLSVRSSNSAIIDTTRVYGVTIDAISGLKNTIPALSNLCRKPTTRIVFDEWIAASTYVNAVNQIHPVSFIMGELLDSYYMSQYNLSQYAARSYEYLNALGGTVDIWEVGNEINGEWLGNTPDVVAKMDTAYKVFKAANKKTALTLYYNKNCWSNPQNEMFRWTVNNVPSYMKTGLDYVFVSYYEDDCNGLVLNWQQIIDSLGKIFPNAKLGIGECGTVNAANKASYITRYYTTAVSHPRWVGGCFWWYFRQDCVPYTNTLWSVLNNAINNIPMPVNLLSFLSSVSGRDTKLNWVTSSELNNSGFDVERIAEGGNWTKVGFVTGNGTTQYPVTYTFEDKNLTTGKYKYRLKQIDYNGSFEYCYLAGDVDVGIPSKFNMSQNYPNPFNPVTKIDFTIPVDSKVSLIIYDVTGREAARLINNEVKKADYYTVAFNGSAFSSGVYFYKIISDKYVQTKKMMIIK
jgi:hypothetical protein